MNRKLKRILILAILAWSSSQFQALANYDIEIERQVKQLKARYSGDLDLLYFHDMGIIARKADEADLSDLAASIVKASLFNPVDDYVKREITSINASFASDAYRASRKVADLAKMDKYFEPSDEFLRTASGRALNSETARLRTEAIKSIRSQPTEQNIIAGIQALRKTGLFYTGSPEEMIAVKELNQELQCGLGWKSKIRYRNSEDFESEYELGTLVENAELKLVSSAQDLTQAKWVGEWRYSYHGREGKGEGVSEAILQFKRGDETAELVIGASKMSSVGRINMPVSLSGERRTLDVQGTALVPEVLLEGYQQIPLSGCKENQVQDGSFKK